MRPYLGEVVGEVNPISRPAVPAAPTTWARVRFAVALFLVGLVSLLAGLAIPS